MSSRFQYEDLRARVPLLASALNSILNSTVDIVELDARLDVVEVLLSSVPAGIEAAEVMLEGKPVTMVGVYKAVTEPGRLPLVVPVRGVCGCSTDCKVLAADVLGKGEEGPESVVIPAPDSKGELSRREFGPVFSGAVDSGGSKTASGPLPAAEIVVSEISLADSDIPGSEILEDSSRFGCSVIRPPDSPEPAVLGFNPDDSSIDRVPSGRVSAPPGLMSLAVLSSVIERPGIVSEFDIVPLTPGTPSTKVVLVSDIIVISIVVT